MRASLVPKARRISRTRERVLVPAFTGTSMLAPLTADKSLFMSAAGYSNCLHFVVCRLCASLLELTKACRRGPEEKQLTRFF